MSKSILSGLSLRSGAILFSLVTALGACATVDAAPHGSATLESLKPSQAAWGYPIGAASSEPETHSTATVSQPAPTTIRPSQAAWGYPIGAASSEPETHSTATVSQPASTTIKPSQAAWGYPIGAASSEPETHGTATVSQPAPTTTCSHQPPAPRVTAQTSC